MKCESNEWHEIGWRPAGGLGGLSSSFNINSNAIAPIFLLQHISRLSLRCCSAQGGVPAVSRSLSQPFTDFTLFCCQFLSLRTLIFCGAIPP
jgi:hypothetical protein